MALQNPIEPRINNEPLPREPLVDREGRARPGFFNWLQGKTFQAGEIISGVLRNTANIVQLQTDYQDADSSQQAQIDANASVSASNEGSIATLSSEVAAARDGEASLLSKVNSIDQAIIDEQGARATDIDSVTARFVGTPTRAASLFTDVADWAASSSGAPSSVASWPSSADFQTVSGLGPVWRRTSSSTIYQKAVTPLRSGDVFRLRSAFNVDTLPTDGDAQCQFVAIALDGDYNSVGGRILLGNTEGQSNTTTGEKLGTLTQSANDLLGIQPTAKYIRWGWEVLRNDTDGQVTTISFEVSNGAAQSGVVENTANITTNATAIADEATARAQADATLTASVNGNTSSINTNATAIVDIEGNLSAAYAVIVDANGRIASLRLLSDGTTATAELLADLIYMGDDTVFEDTQNSFVTETGGNRYRYGGPFGASTDLLQWFGPDSVSQGSETRTNGYFAFGTDGKVYYGTAELTTGGNALAATVSPTFATDINGTKTSVTVTPTGGTGPYSYSYSGPFFTAASPSSATTNFNYTGPALGADDAITSTVICTVTDNVGATTQVAIGVTKQNISGT